MPKTVHALPQVQAVHTTAKLTVTITQFISKVWGNKLAKGFWKLFWSLFI